MKQSAEINAFNAGELSPLMAARTDYKYYKQGQVRLHNFVPAPQGPIRRRPGTTFVAEAKHRDRRCLLHKFVFSAEQSYTLEFGHLYVRFFYGHGAVVDGGGVPIEVTTPYREEDLFNVDGHPAIRFAQFGDSLYIVHKLYAPRKLVRTGLTSFTLQVVDFSGGPFKDIDPDSAITVYASAATGSVSLTASASLFSASQIGRKFYIEQALADAITQWEPGKSITTNDVRRSDGKNYVALNTATTGTSKPIHSDGAVFDGDTGVQWQFLDFGYGHGTITAVASGTSATMSVIERLPGGAVGSGNANNRWAFDAWSDEDGWPDSIVFFRSRLCFFRNGEFWMSVVLDYESMATKDDAGLTTADMAIISEITSGELNDIEWVASSGSALLLGTGGSEHAIGEISASEPLGSANIRAKDQSNIGARHISAIKIGSDVIFCQKAGRKLLAIFQAESVEEKWVTDDLTIRAAHITKGGVKDMVYQQDPDSIVWLGIGDEGRLAGLTIERAQEVIGWHTHSLGGRVADPFLGSINPNVESMVVKQSPDGDSYELWLCVRRTVGGVTVRHIEYVNKHHEKGDDPYRAVYLDCSLSLPDLSETLTTVAAIEGETTTFNASGNVFVAGDVGRQIGARRYSTSVDGKITWTFHRATITAYTSPSSVIVQCITSWPDSVFPAEYWRLSVTEVSGLDHIEGETVGIFVDGTSHPDDTVQSGVVQLDAPAFWVTAGFNYTSVLIPTNLVAGEADGSSMNKTQRVNQLTVLVEESLGFKYGPNLNALDEAVVRDSDDNANEAPPMFSGTIRVPWPDGYQEQIKLMIVQDLPFPTTILAMVAETTSN